MCGRYNIIPDAEAWTTAFSLSEDIGKEISLLVPSYNVAPTQEVPIVRNNRETGARELILVHWGLVPFWAEDRSIGYRLINARAKSVTEKLAFRAAFRKRRCLIPASGFYEWRKSDSEKQPMLIRMKDESPFAFAGLWESWCNPYYEVEMDSCTIITTQANSFMARIHNRMPVILDANDYNRWLDPNNSNGELLLQPCPDEWLDAQPVSTYVNNPGNNDSKCIERVDTDDPLSEE